MKDLKASEIIKKFPKIYGEPSTNGYFHYVEFECSKGWYSLILELSENLQKILDQDKSLTIEISKVSAKYGELCFNYRGNCSDEMHTLIHKAESDSFVICEICGDEGKLITDISWWVTRCEKCFAKEHRR